MNWGSSYLLDVVVHLALNFTGIEKTNASYELAIEFLQNLSLITIAVSLGMVDTVIEHPASMTHSAVPFNLLSEQVISEIFITGFNSRIDQNISWN